MVVLGNLDDSLTAPGINDGFSKRAVTCRSSDLLREHERLEVGDLSLVARGHRLAQIILNTDFLDGGSDVGGWLDLWLLAGNVDVEARGHGHAIARSNIE